MAANFDFTDKTQQSVADAIQIAKDYLGFREEFSINTNRLAEQLCATELQTNPDTSKEFLEDIRALVINATHIVHYHLVSNQVQDGCVPPVVNFVRKWLIEGIYNRLATMFPQTANWMTPAEEIINIGINAFV